jgi:hypothetical protein
MRPPAGEEGRAVGEEGGKGAARSERSEFSTLPALEVLEVLDLLLGAGEAAAGVPLLEGVDLVERGLDILDLLVK